MYLLTMRAIHGTSNRDTGVPPNMGTDDCLCHLKGQSVLICGVSREIPHPMGFN